MNHRRRLVTAMSGGAASTYTISGTVYDADGTTVVADATVALGAYSAVSAANGTYTISDVPAGTSGSMTCTKAALNWTAITVSAMSGNLTAQNYTANYNLLTGLRSYWKLDETTGTRVDSLGNNNLGGTPGSPSYATGIISNGVAADGTNYLLKTTGISDNLQTAGVSCWGWINVSDFTGRKGIIQDSGSVNMELNVESANSIRFIIADSVSGSSLANNASVSLSTGTWYFVWGRYDPATKKAEVGYNAVAGTLGSALTNGAKTITRLEILRGSATIANNTTIDEVGYMLRKITDAEIAALYNGGTGLTYPF